MATIPGKEDDSDQAGLIATLKRLEPIEEDFPEVDEGLMEADDIDLSP